MPNENEIEKIASIIESLLFVSDQPLTVGRLKEILELDDISLIQQALQLLRESYEQPLRGFELKEVAGGFQLRSRPDNAQWILTMNQAKPQRLSRAALETLAIIAYKQPLTRPEIESIRGVDCGQVLKTLLEKDLVKILGKKEEPGTPLVYGTAETFLHFFGIKGLNELPSLKEYNELREANETITIDDYAKALDAMPTPTPTMTPASENSEPAADVVSVQPE